jgi:diacylglycerol kinase (ATP)
MGPAVDRLLSATLNTWNGLLAATRGEAAFRQELVVLAAAVPLAFLIGSDLWRSLALIASIILILVIELINTAIEKLADVITPTRDPRIGRIKDMGSAAVALAILIAGLVWLAALSERLLLI